MRKLLASTALVLVCLLIVASTPVLAQDAEGDAPPLQCWLKSMRSAVLIGEHFNVALTCSVLETPRLAAVPDLAQIDPATIQMPPFEVMRGVRRPDVRAGSRRFFQFEYTLRVIADSFFGRDLPIPPVTLKYSLAMNSGDASQQGREHAYVLPAIPVRVLSLVPQHAADIRDASRNTFEEIEQRRFRGQIADTAAIVLFVFAAVFLLLAMTAGVERFRGTTLRGVRELPDGALVTACMRALRRVRSQVASEGWTPQVVAQCLAALRVGSAVALGRPVSQTIVDSGVQPADGQIAIRMGLLRPRRVLVSAAVTPASVAAQSVSESAGIMPMLRQPIADLREALVVFSALRFESADRPSRSAIENAVDAAVGALIKVRIASSAPVQFFYGIGGAFRRWRLAWTR